MEVWCRCGRGSAWRFEGFLGPLFALGMELEFLCVCQFAPLLSHVAVSVRVCGIHDFAFHQIAIHKIANEI